MSKKVVKFNDKPQNLMTKEELNQYYMKTTGKTYEEFLRECKSLTDKEKKEYGLII